MLLDERTVLTINDCMGAAMAALMRGDLEERDRWIALVERELGTNLFIDGNQPVALDRKGMN